MPVLSAITSIQQEDDGRQLATFADGNTAYINLAVTMAAIVAGAAAAYRSNVTAADVIAAPGTVTTSVQAGGSATAGTYNVKIVAGNQYGRTTATAGSAATTATTNLTVRAAFAQVTGATFYDVYVSTDADPKWVGRITETQRASGILITAVGVTGAGGTAGAVDVQVPGTGLQAATTAAQNFAYNIPATVNCANYQYVDFDITFSRTGDAVASALTVIPMLTDSNSGNYHAAVPVSLTFGGAASTYQPNTQTVRVECRGRSAVALVVAAIAGTGASVNVSAVLS